MNILLKIEWLKLKSYKTFYILVGLFILLFIFWNYGVASSMLKIGGDSGLLASSYSFPGVWGNMGYWYSWFIIFLSVFVIISISNEFTFRTHRQHIIDGLSRLDFLHAKCLLILLISMMATLVLLIFGLVFGFVNGGGNPGENIIKVLYAAVFTLNYLSFAGLLALFIRKSGLSIIILLAFFFVEAILSNVINYQTGTKYGNFFPLQCSDELLPFPALQNIGKMLGAGQDNISPWMYMLVSAIWIVIYYVLARRKFLKTDL